MSETDIQIDFDGNKSTFWEPLPDLRQIMAVQNPQTLGPMLQRAWRCREDGRIEWRRVPIHIVTVAEFLEASA